MIKVLGQYVIDVPYIGVRQRSVRERLVLDQERIIGLLQLTPAHITHETGVIENNPLVTTF